jgi:hypothetical protein
MEYETIKVSFARHQMETKLPYHIWFQIKIIENGK